MATQALPALLQRCHTSVKLVGSSLQVPWVALSSSPSVAVPVMAGGTEATGGAGSGPSHLPVMICPAPSTATHSAGETHETPVRKYGSSRFAGVQVDDGSAG